jgi:hypothetical protein
MFFLGTPENIAGRKRKRPWPVFVQRPRAAS